MEKLKKYYRSFNHKQKALIATIIVELILIFLMFQTVFPYRQPQKELSIRFIEDQFDFEELKQPEKEALPDVDKIVEKLKLSSKASNEWLKKNFSEEQNTEEETIEESGEEGEEETHSSALDELSKEKPAYHFNESKKQNKPSENSLEKSFKGQSSIKYYVPNRYKTHLINPVYTCPDYMHGRITIRIGVDRSGKVIKAAFDPKASTAHYDCLIETALKYSYRAHFNHDENAPEMQTGYIEFIF